VARRPSRLALLEASCQGTSEDFVPPAAQRRSVRRTPEESLMPESVGASCLLTEEFGPSRLRVALGQVEQPLTRKGSLRHSGAVARRGVRAYTDA